MSGIGYTSREKLNGERETDNIERKKGMTIDYRLRYNGKIRMKQKILKDTL